MPGSHMRMYFAAVAPPKPAPITTTRAFACEPKPAQPPAASAVAAPASLRKLRLSTMRFIASPYFFCAEKYSAIRLSCGSV